MHTHLDAGQLSQLFIVAVLTIGIGGTVGAGAGGPTGTSTIQRMNPNFSSQFQTIDFGSSVADGRQG